MVKSFVKPFCEVVRFSGSIMTVSGCGCWDGEDDWGTGADCTSDIAYCDCEKNNLPGQANCCVQVEGA